MIRSLERLPGADAMESIPHAPQAAEMASAPVPKDPSKATAGRSILELAVWALVVGGSLAIFWPILPDLWRVWLDDPDNSHGLLVPLVSAVLIWSRRDEFQAIEVRPSPWGFVFAGCALMLYLAALRVHLALPARIALPLTIMGLLWGNFGAARLRAIAFPLAFLGFMIPAPDTLVGLVSFPLQRFASAVSARLLALGGFPVLREGTMLYFPNASLEVAEACSGIRSMASYGVLGVLFAYLGRDRLSAPRQTLIVVTAVPLALAVNVLRVTGTGVLATYVGSRAAQGFLHEFSGFVVFALGFLLLWGFSGLLSRVRRQAPPTGPRGFLAHRVGV